MRRISSNSESGAILAIVIILMLALTITGIAFLNAGVMEYRLAKREDYKNKAFYIAEGGLDRTIWNLKQDFESGNRDWTDDINGVPVVDLPADDPDYPDGWRLFDYDEASLSLGDGVYLVKVKYVGEDEIWVKSTGTVEGVPRTVQVLAELLNLSAWNNAIFAKGGSVGGTVIEGNALISGSVHILGNALEPEDWAMNMSGTAGIRNNYEVMPDGPTVDLVAKVPDCPTTTFNGEIVESLGTILRVKHGKVGLDSAAAEVGQGDVPGDFLELKETVDGVYVTDGYGGSHGEENVHSDNGTAYGYDLGDKVKFPELSDPYLDSEGVAYEYPIGNPLTYLDYLKHCALKILDGEITNNEISSDTGDFNLISLGYFDPVINDTTQSKISWHWDEEEGKGILEVEGVVWVEAASLDLGIKKEIIEYRGNGIIVVGQVVDGTHIQGDIRVSANLVAVGSYVPGGEGGFPNNVLGLIAQNIYLAPDPCDSQLTMTGAFYAENQIVSAKQNEIAGTFVCKEFNISAQVPRIYQVPELANNLPPGMPGGTPIWSISTSQWSES